MNLESEREPLLPWIVWYWKEEKKIKGVWKKKNHVWFQPWLIERFFLVGSVFGEIDEKERKKHNEVMLCLYCYDD